MLALALETKQALSETAKTAKTDIPDGSTVLRIEPIVSAAAWVVVAMRIYWPDGTDYGAAAMLRANGNTTPRYELNFERSLTGAKVVAQAFLPDGAVNVSVRVTAADKSENLPSRKLSDVKGA